MNELDSDSARRCALMSSSFECWRKKQNPYPIYVPQQLRAFLPARLPAITPALRQARRHDEAKFEQANSSIQRELKAVKHPFCDNFAKQCGPAYKPDKKRWTDIDIDFDSDEQTTNVTVWSLFPGVERKRAIDIIRLADPPNWAPAVDEFFKQSTPVVCQDGTYGPQDEAAPVENKYKLLERVEWNFSTSVQGGIINILEITDHKVDPGGYDAAATQNFIRRVIKEVLRDEKERLEAESNRLGEGKLTAERKKEVQDRLNEVESQLNELTEQPEGQEEELKSQLQGQLQQVDGHLGEFHRHLEEFHRQLEELQSSKKMGAQQNGGGPPIRRPLFAFPYAHYDYRLECCVQSKLLSSWERGGLDVDEGSYRAIWLADTDGAGAKHDTGTFFLEATKKIRYSNRANVIPELSQLLNLLAPAVTSMLMKQLGFEGIQKFLDKGPTQRQREVLG